jgi:hypothetical protein
MPPQSPNRSTILYKITYIIHTKFVENYIDSIQNPFPSVVLRLPHVSKPFIK